MRALLAKGAKPTVIGAAGSGGRAGGGLTPLHNAAMRGHEGCLRAMLERTPSGQADIRSLKARYYPVRHSPPPLSSFGGVLRSALVIM